MARSIIATLLYIEEQAKGLPLGIPLAKSTAVDLVKRGLLEWAPCSYLHLIKKRMSSVRLTTAGETYLKLYRERKTNACRPRKQGYFGRMSHHGSGQ